MTQTYLSPQATIDPLTSRAASAAGRLGSNGVLGDHDYQKSGVTFLLQVVLEDGGFQDSCSCGIAFQGDPLQTSTLLR